MNEIQQQVTRARWRLVVQSFLHWLSQNWLITFSLAVVGLLVPKIWPIPVDANLWWTCWCAGAVFVGILSALIITLVRRPTLLQAATEVDLRLKLNERISSSMHLTPEVQSTPIGQALMEDAQRTAERIDVRDAFAIQLAPYQLWSLLPIVLAGLTLLIPNATTSKTSTEMLDANVLTQVKNSAKDLAEQVRKQRENSEHDDLEEAEFFKQVESKLEDLQKPQSKDAKKILSDINQLKESIEKRRSELGSSENLRKNLAGLKSMEKGPAEKMADSIQDGEFEKAIDELQKMMSDLESGKMSAEMQEKLAKQMEQMAEALQEAVAEHQAAAKELEKQIADAELAGDAQKVAELRQKLADNQAQAEAMEQMQQMANGMKEAQEALKNGDQAAAKKAMEKMKQQMEKMNQADKQLKDLKQLMDAAEKCKNCANGQCDGEGDKGRSDKESLQWKKGMGEGRGSGPRDEKETDTRSIDSQVRTEMKDGETVYGGKAGGVNRKGVTREEVKEAILSAEIEDPEAIDSLPLPKKQRDQARDYYDSLRVGK
jgi:hypothetical protein